MFRDSGKWTDLRILVSFSWPVHLTMPTVFVRNGTHNDHPPCIKEKKFFFLCTGQPKTIAAIIPSLLPMSKGNLAAKQNQQGNYISNFFWNLDSMVTLHLRATDLLGGNWCPLLMEEVNYAPETLGHKLTFHSVDKMVPFFIVLLLTPGGSDFIDLKSEVTRIV